MKRYPNSVKTQSFVVKTECSVGQFTVFYKHLESDNLLNYIVTLGKLKYDQYEYNEQGCKTKNI